jgi:hypothetical protein
VVRQETLAAAHTCGHEDVILFLTERYPDEFDRISSESVVCYVAMFGTCARPGRFSEATAVTGNASDAIILAEWEKEMGVHLGGEGPAVDEDESGVAGGEVGSGGVSCGLEGWWVGGGSVGCIVKLGIVDG